MAAVLTAGAAGAGVVHTVSQSLTGPVALADGGVQVAGRAVRTVPSEQILLVAFEREAMALRQANVVRWTNGEVWACEILTLSAGKLKVRSTLFGTREVASGGAGVLEFRANLAPEPPGTLKPTTLYRPPMAAGGLARERSDPLPGALLWISPEQIAVDSPLGAMTLERKSVTRFSYCSAKQRFAAQHELTPKRDRTARVGEAEVLLLDGSVFRGAAALARRGVALRHAALGELAIPVAAVRAVLFHRASAVYLTDLAARVTAAQLPGAGAVEVARRRTGAFMRSVRVAAGSEVRYALSSQPRPAVLRAMLGPVAGARADATVRVAVGGKVLFETSVSRNARTPRPISVDLGSAKDVRIGVSFAGAIRFPCGAVLGDPHVVTRAAQRSAASQSSTR